MMTKPKEERMVTFRRGANGEVEVIVRGDVPADLVARIREHRHELVAWLEQNGGQFPPTTH
jgi:hypothetical protein